MFVDFALAIRTKRSARVGAQARRRNVVAACAAKAEPAHVDAFKSRFKAAFLQAQPFPDSGTHCLLLHGIHSREPADAGLIQFDGNFRVLLWRQRSVHCRDVRFDALP